MSQVLQSFKPLSFVLIMRVCTCVHLSVYVHVSVGAVWGGWSYRWLWAAWYDAGTWTRVPVRTVCAFHLWAVSPGMHCPFYHFSSLCLMGLHVTFPQAHLSQGRMWLWQLAPLSLPFSSPSHAPLPTALERSVQDTNKETLESGLCTFQIPPEIHKLLSVRKLEDMWEISVCSFKVRGRLPAPQGLCGTLSEVLAPESKDLYVLLLTRGGVFGKLTEFLWIWCFYF